MEHVSEFEISQLVSEFKQITEEYETALAKLPRRHDIVYELIQSGLMYRQVAALLGISTGRVGQLVKGAAAYVPPHLPGE